jgi:hypothetical protein
MGKTDRNVGNVSRVDGATPQGQGWGRLDLIGCLSIHAYLWGSWRRGTGQDEASDCSAEKRRMIPSFDHARR